MFKTGDEAVRWIHSRKKFGSRPGLIRVNELLKLCGHPEKNSIGIHIAGTNGKGSTVTYLRCLLEMQKLAVGTFTVFMNVFRLMGKQSPQKNLSS